MYPINRIEEYLLHSILFRSWLNFIHVLPLSNMWKTHENGLNACFRCVQAELSASIINEVKLDISSPTNSFPLHVFFFIRRVLSPL